MSNTFAITFKCNDVVSEAIHWQAMKARITPEQFLLNILVSSPAMPNHKGYYKAELIPQIIDIIQHLFTSYYGKRGLTEMVAGELNLHGFSNASGQPWTADRVNGFMVKYMPDFRRNLRRRSLVRV